MSHVRGNTELPIKTSDADVDYVLIYLFESLPRCFHGEVAYKIRHEIPAHSTHKHIVKVEVGQHG